MGRTFSIVFLQTFTMANYSVACFLLAAIAYATAANLSQRQEGDCTDTWPDHCPGRIGKGPAECYHESIAKGCCKSCQEKNSGTPGCECGNKAGWCTDYSASDCGSTPGVEENCCELCGGGSGGGEEGGEKFLRQAMNYTNKRQEGDCTDTWPDHCPGRIEKGPAECYHESIAKGCCKSCQEKNSGTPGCEYGNKAGWCTDYSA